MKRKVTIFVVFLLTCKLFATNLDFNPFKDNARPKDYFIASGEMIMINLLVYDANNLFLSSKPTQTSFQVFRDNLTSPWIFDYSSFKRNQIFHPYFGALYYLSGRSNNLNFAESFLLSAAGSFIWETYLEGPTVSLNDFITTPTAGAITGEILHRLSCSVYDKCALLSWILSPVDGINQLLKDKRAATPAGSIYSQSYSILSGFTINQSSLCPEAGFAINIIYSNPFGHKTKELYDQFTLDIYYTGWKNNNLLKLDMDGFLYSIPLYFSNESLQNIALTFDYDIIYSDSLTLSNSSAGIQFSQSLGSRENNLFEYSIQADYIFMATSDLFYILNNPELNYKKSAYQPPYTFKHGPQTKIKLYYSNPITGIFQTKAQAQLLFNYKESTSDPLLESSVFIFTNDFSYEHQIYKNWNLGLRDLLIIKKEFNNQLTSNFEFSNKSDLYIKYNIE